MKCEKYWSKCYQVSPESLLSIHIKSIKVKASHLRSCLINPLCVIKSIKLATVVVIQLLSHSNFCDSLNCSMPGFPVLHYLPEFAQIHGHWVGDAIQSSHPLLTPSPRALNLSHHQGLFQWVSSLHQVAKELELWLQHPSFQWTFRVDFLWIVAFPRKQHSGPCALGNGDLLWAVIKLCQPQWDSFLKLSRSDLAKVNSIHILFRVSWIIWYIPSLKGSALNFYINQFEII